MKFGLGLDGIPELADLEPDQRQEIWASTAGSRLKDPVVLVAMLGYGALAGLGGAAGAGLIGSVLGIVVGVGAGSLLGIVPFWRLANKRARPHLAAEIRARGWTAPARSAGRADP